MRGGAWWSPRPRGWSWAVSRFKQARTVATRYDKRRYVYLGTATVAALTIWLRT